MPVTNPGVHFAGPLSVGAKKYKAINGTAYTVLGSDNGRTFTLGGTGVAITLPAPVAGANFRFLVTAVFGTDYVITATGAIMSGPIIEAGVVQTCAGATTLTLEDGAEALGDFFNFESDGTIWAIEGQFQTAASITVA